MTRRNEPSTSRVVCVRVADGTPITPSDERACGVCAEPVWLSRMTQEALAADGHVIEVRCGECVAREGDYRFTVHPAQIADMRRAGLTYPQMAHVIALASMAGPPFDNARADAMMAQLRDAKRHSRLARAYRREVKRARKMIDEAAASEAGPWR